MPRPDVVLVTVDSFRADSAGFLTDETLSTPTIDTLANGATHASAATSPSSHTRASVPAILTSQYSHRFFTNFLQDVDVPTIAQRLSTVGYQTAAFHSNPLLSRHFGYDRGFDTFNDGLRFVKGTTLPETLTRAYSKAIRLLRRFPYQPAETITEKAVGWLDGVDSPFFLWVHYMDPHGPYALNRKRGYLDKFRSEKLWHKAISTPEEVTDDELRQLRTAYHEEIKHTDRELAPLFDAIGDNTNEACIVLTGDHGEEFREHGQFTHMPKLHEEVTRVPFILDLPRVDEIQALEPISLLDIVPTLLAQVEGVEPESTVGLDLSATETQREHVITETNHENGDVSVGIRTDRYKYIARGERRELYDLVRDPNEEEDLIGTDHDTKVELERILSTHVDEHRIDGGDKLAATAADLNSEMQGRLEDLGYL